MSDCQACAPDLQRRQRRLQKRSLKLAVGTTDDAPPDGTWSRFDMVLSPETPTMSALGKADVRCICGDEFHEEHLGAGVVLLAGPLSTLIDWATQAYKRPGAYLIVCTSTNMGLGDTMSWLGAVQSRAQALAPASLVLDATESAIAYEVESFLFENPPRLDVAFSLLPR